MMAQAKVSKVCEVNAEALWREIRQFNKMDEILPDMVTQCIVEGSGQGATRVCVTEQGNIEETLTELDDENYTLSYSIDNEDCPLPVSNYIGTVQIVKSGENTCSFTWGASFAAKGMEETLAVEMLEGAFSQAIDNFITRI